MNYLNKILIFFLLILATTSNAQIQGIVSGNQVYIEDVPWQVAIGSIN